MKSLSIICAFSMFCTAISLNLLNAEESGWQELSSGTTETLNNIHFIDDHTGWVAGTNGTVLHTTDGGETWNQQTSGTNKSLVDIHFVDAVNGWIAGDGIFLRTIDGGNTWDSVDNDYYHAVYFIDPLNGWVADGGVKKSTDGGQTWDRMPYNSFMLYDIHMFDQMTGLVAGDAGAISKTTDGGETWDEKTTDTWESFRSLFFIDDQIGWAGGVSGEVIHTKDGGESWTIQSTGTTTFINSIHFVNDTMGWTSGWGGIILHTTDGGNNWQLEDSIPDVSYNSVFFTSKHTGWAAGNAGTIIKYSSGENGGTNDDDPPAVISFTPENGADNVSLMPEFIWDKVDIAETYQLQVSTNDSFSVTVIDTTVTDTFYTHHEELNPLTTYYWRVRVGSTFKTGEWSDVWSFTTESGTALNVIENDFATKAYPNPFSQQITIEFSLPANQHISLELLNAKGQVLEVMLDNYYQKGKHQATVNTEELSPGMYFYRLKTGGVTETGMLFLER